MTKQLADASPADTSINRHNQCSRLMLMLQILGDNLVGDFAQPNEAWLQSRECMHCLKRVQLVCCSVQAAANIAVITYS